VANDYSWRLYSAFNTTKKIYAQLVEEELKKLTGFRVKGGLRMCEETG